MQASTNKRPNPRRRKRVRFSSSEDTTPSRYHKHLTTTDETLAFTINDQPQSQISLFAEKAIEIPPCSEHFIRMKLARSTEPTEGSYFVQGHPDQKLEGIFVAHALTFVTKAPIYIRIANVTDSTIMIPKNVRLATVSPTKPVHQLVAQLATKPRQTSPATQVARIATSPARSNPTRWSHELRPYIGGTYS